MKFLITFIVCLLCHFSGISQECSGCNERPKISTYDFDVQIPEPEVKGEKLKWMQLFYLSRHANAALQKETNNCINFRMGISQAMLDDGIMKVGATEAILPPPKLNEGYFVTGTVSNAGGTYQVIMELKAACSGKVVASSGQLPFDYSSSSEYIASIARQAASRLMPVYEKIREYEEEQRNNQPDIVFIGNTRNLIKLKPVNLKLAAGQETEVKIELKDCDGTPVKNATIDFGPSTKTDFEMEGTTGGVAIPSKVVTDATGKATIKFRKAPGNSVSILNAHCYVNTASGCEDMLIGSTPVGSAWFQVDFSYDMSESKGMGLQTTTEVYSMNVGSEQVLSRRRHFTSLFHHPGINDTRKISVNIWPKKIPGMNDQSKTVYVMDDGYYYFTKAAGFTVVTSDFAPGAYISDANQSYSNFGKAEKESRPEIHFNIDSGKLVNFSIEFNYPTELKVPEDQEKIPSGFTLESHTPLTKFTQTKITDPSSPYKTKYEVLYYKKQDHKSGAVYNVTGDEFCHLTIWSPY